MSAAKSNIPSTRSRRPLHDDLVPDAVVYIVYSATNRRALWAG